MISRTARRRIKKCLLWMEVLFILVLGAAVGVFAGAFYQISKVLPPQSYLKQYKAPAGTTIWSSDKEMMPIPDNHVVLNAGEAPRWYRSARIQGWATVEWPHSVRPPVNPLWEVVKPLKHNCTCHPDVHRMGRYGKWTKGVLSHEAFYETAKINQEQGVLF